MIFFFSSSSLSLVTGIGVDIIDGIFISCERLIFIVYVVSGVMSEGSVIIAVASRTGLTATRGL